MFCDKCGFQLEEDAKFCPECGAKIDGSQEKTYCVNCGNEIADGAFCEECGTKINNPQSQETFIEKYKIPIIVGIVIVIIVIAGMIIQFSSQPEQIDLPAQRVTVGAEYFEIPGFFALNSTPLDIQNDGGVNSFSQTFCHDGEYISIAVMSSVYNVDLESVAASEGGVHKTLMGYDGYYNEMDVSAYSFTFVMDNKLCVIQTSSPYLFDEIKVL